MLESNRDRCIRFTRTELSAYHGLFSEPPHLQQLSQHSTAIRWLCTSSLIETMFPDGNILPKVMCIALADSPQVIFPLKT
jgi:hypothetical protein